MKRSLLMLFGLAILAHTTVLEAASTKINKKHPLLSTETSDAAASVYFIRPSAGFRGVMGRRLSIRLDGEELLKLKKGQYTLVRLKPWEGQVVVKSSAVVMVGGGNSMIKVEEARHFAFVAGEYYYILMSERIRDMYQGSSFPPIPIPRERAVEITASLTPVGDAVEVPLASDTALESPPQGSE